MNTPLRPQLHKHIVRQRITTINGLTMSDELFSRLADEFTEYLVDTIGLEMLDKMQIFAPLSGKFWQLQYVAHNVTQVWLVAC